MPDGHLADPESGAHNPQIQPQRSADDSPGLLKEWGIKELLTLHAVTFFIGGNIDVRF